MKTQMPSTKTEQPYQEAWQVFKQNRLAVIGLVLFLFFTLVALAGLWTTSGNTPICDPSLVRLTEKLRPPLSQANIHYLAPDESPPFGRYLLGTDDLGRDIFSRMLQGAWVSLTVGFVAVGIAVFIGVCIGGLAGYFGYKRITLKTLAIFTLLLLGLSIEFFFSWKIGIFFLLVTTFLICYPTKTKKNIVTFFLEKSICSVDTILMRFVDIMMCFPSFFLILTVVALLPASIYNIMIVIGLTSWMGTTRFVRAEFLSLREQDFVLAARALGVKHIKIIFRYMIPNAIAPVLISTTIGIATAILTEAGLSFLGFGVPPPHATWGNILSDGKRFIFDAPWITFVPGIAILLVVLSFNLFGEGLRDITNPRLRRKIGSE